MKNIVNIEERCKFIDIHGNSRTLKFDNFSKFQYVISDRYTDYISTYGKLIEIQREDSYRPKYTKIFYSVWRETSFLSVYVIYTTCFEECFLSHMIIQWFSAIVCCCILWNKYFEWSPHILYPLSPQ